MRKLFGLTAQKVRRNKIKSTSEQLIRVFLSIYKMEFKRRKYIAQCAIARCKEKRLRSPNGNTAVCQIGSVSNENSLLNLDLVQPSSAQFNSSDWHHMPNVDTFHMEQSSE